MSPAQAKQTVLVSMVILVGIAVFRGRSTGQVFRRVWGTGVVGVFLSLAADFAPAVAGPFAALVVLGSLTNGGDKALQALLGGGPTGMTSPLPTGGLQGPLNAKGQVTQPTTVAPPPAGGANPSGGLQGPVGPSTSGGSK